MSKKQPPHLVMAKQPTVTNRDPFQTSREEEKYTALFSDALDTWKKKLITQLKKEVESRELAAGLPAGIAELETNDLKAKAWAYVEKGYLKGVQLTSQSLEKLNIDISINLGTRIPKDSLTKFRKRQSDFIGTWQTEMQQKAADIIARGLDNGTPLSTIIDQIDEETNKGLIWAKREASNQIIEAARQAEYDTYQQAGVEIYRWITVVDSKTCPTCIALQGRIYMDDPADRGLVNYDSGDFLKDEIEEAAPPEDIESGFIDPEDAKYGPIVHSYCRCHLAPVVTREQYSGSVNKIVSEV